MRNVLVTGASRGLGLAVATRLAADGFAVTAVARKPSDALEQAVALAPGCGLAAGRRCCSRATRRRTLPTRDRSGR